LLARNRRVLAVGIALPGLVLPAAAVADDPPATPPSAGTSAPPPPESPPGPPVVVAPPPRVSLRAPKAMEPNERGFGLVLGLAGSALWNPVADLVTTYDYSAEAGLHGRWSPSIGISWQRPLKGPWTFVPEIWYHQFGTRLFGVNNLVYDTIAVPLMYRRYDLAHKPITPFIEVGPEFSFALATRSFNSLIPYGGGYASAPYSEGPIGLLRQLDAGVRFGVGVSFPLHNARLLLSVRGYQGVLPRDLGSEMIVFNRQVVLSAGITFGQPKP
jgi:hypothetical protein